MRTLKQAVEDAYHPKEGGMSVGLPTCTVDASQLRALLLRVNAQQAHIERLEEALRWYADKENYDNQIAISRGDGSYEYSVPVMEDSGSLARAALGMDSGEG